jgi:hypothetical protein
MSGVQQGAKHVVTGGAESIKELEGRLGGTMGIEVRGCCIDMRIQLFHEGTTAFGTTD